MGTASSKHRSLHQSPGRPSVPGKPVVVAAPAGCEPDVVNIRWEPPEYHGSTKLLGYRVEQRRAGSPHWVRTSPVLVRTTGLAVGGLEPGATYQFRVSAENESGRSLPGHSSQPISISSQRHLSKPPSFVTPLIDTVCIENEKVELCVVVEGSPTPTIKWFKEGVELFSNRRQRVQVEAGRSSLLIHQAALSDEGELRCTATNRAGHVVSKAKLTLQAGAGIRMPRQYEEGVLFELGETVRLRVGVTGRPRPEVRWYHEGRPVEPTPRTEITRSERHASLTVTAATRAHRGEYTVTATNPLGTDSSSILVTITDRPVPPGRVEVMMTLGRCVTLSWTPPPDDGGCNIGNYIVEYYRVGWDVWLKAATCRQISTTLGELIEGSQYRFRVKAENPYGVSEPSPPSELVFIPDPSRGLLEPPGKSEGEAGGEPSWDNLVKGQCFSWSPSSEGTPTAPARTNRKKTQIQRDGWATDEAFEGTNADSSKEHSSESSEEDSMGDRFESLNRGRVSSALPDKVEKAPPGLEEKKSSPIREMRSCQKDKSDWAEFRADLRRYSNTDDTVHSSTEMMLVLLPKGKENASHQSDFSDKEGGQDKLSTVLPPISLSSPELSSCDPIEQATLRISVSSSELLYEKSMARINQEMVDQEVEQSLKSKYGLDRRRSFERRESADKHKVGAQILKPKQPDDFTPKQSTKDKFLQSDTSFENFSTRIEPTEYESEYDESDFEEDDDDEYDESSDIEMKYDFDKSRISRYIRDTSEEETYHPVMTLTLPTVPEVSEPQSKESSPHLPDRQIPIITLNEEVLETSPTFPRKETNLKTTANNSLLSTKERRKDRTTTDDTKPDEESYSNDRSEVTGNSCVVPKPILKVREPTMSNQTPEKKFGANIMSRISLRKSPVRSSERPQLQSQESIEKKNKKKVRIEEPYENELLQEDDKNLVMTGFVAKNRRKGANRGKVREKNDAANVAISHYSDIVREYGNYQKPKTTLYLNYDELKAAAEKTESLELSQSHPVEDLTVRDDAEELKSQGEPNQPSEVNVVTSQGSAETQPTPLQPYSELILDFSLFVIASYLYIFKDARLAIPVLFLMIYRQLHESIARKCPDKIKSLFRKMYNP